MGWIKEIKNQEQKIKYSQNGEEYLIKYIFDNMGIKEGFFVDIGAWDGTHLSNTKLLRENGWLGLLVDGKDFPGVLNRFVTKENILDILKVLNTPIDFDLLAIDIDGNDYWVLREILGRYNPKLIVSEFNSEHPLDESKTIEYDPKFELRASDYYGYTYGAGVKLAKEFGYTIIYQQSNMNLFYLRNDLLTEEPEFSVEMFRHWNEVSDKKWIKV